ncbi:hypothetical protein SUVZ_02G3410 [Saccharomyces uvarum]|uniref:SVF1-like protein n=1 Tax=Saccharomyces uvarum TaxID=230603 RepID=A0ABN8WNQ8_SACUV|nr:hypothetical protein SUVZ_02G3410 [Saccharomyces uvarum]
MSQSRNEKIKFASIKEVDYKMPVSKSKKYTLIDAVQPLEWYCNNDSETGYQQTINNKSDGTIIVNGGIGLFKVVKKSMETRVETQTLYFTDLQSGLCGFVQLLYSTVMGGIYKGFQLNFKIFRSENNNNDYDVWESFKLNDITEFKPLRFVSRNVIFEFLDNKDEKLGSIGQLSIKCDLPTCNNTIQNLKIDLLIDLFQGFKMNPNGCNYYFDKEISATDELISSDKMVRHVFVPKGSCNGQISYDKKLNNGSFQSKVIELTNVPVSYLDAVQGLLPNKAASNWNFLCFHSENYSILAIEFTTPQEYDNATVTVWSISEKNKLTAIGSSVQSPKRHVRFRATSTDKENHWIYPTSIKFPGRFSEHNLRLVNRYDVLGELPSMVRSLAQKIVSINPFIYQYCQPSKFKHEKGISIIESTFIS